MRHSQCRRALLEGELRPEVAEHLERCERCLAFSRDLGLVAEYAAHLVPPPAPPDLADRVVERLRREGPMPAPGTGAREAAAGVPVRPPRTAPVPFPHARPALATLALAAVLVLVVGVLAVLPNRREGTPVAGDRELRPLLTAAERTAAAKTARLRLSGTATLEATVPRAVSPPRPQLSEPLEAPELPSFVPPPRPDLSEVPEEAREELRRQYERAVREARQAYERALADARARREELRAQLEAEIARVRVPHRVSVEVAVQGEGEVVFPDRLHVRGTMTLVRSDPPAPEARRQPFEVIVVGDNSFYRGADGTWVKVPGPSGPLGKVLLDPDAVVELLEAVAASPVAAGEEVTGGVRTRRFRYGVKGSVFGPRGRVSGRAEASIGEDGLLRRLRLSSEGGHEAGPFRSRVTSTTTVELFDFGAPVTIEPPPAALTLPSPFGLGALLFPFDERVGASFVVGVRVPRGFPFSPSPPARDS